MIVIIEFAEEANRFDVRHWMDDLGKAHFMIANPSSFGNAVVSGEKFETVGHNGTPKAAGKRVGFEVDG